MAIKRLDIVFVNRFIMMLFRMLLILVSVWKHEPKTNFLEVDGYSEKVTPLRVFAVGEVTLSLISKYLTKCLTKVVLPEPKSPLR